MMNFRKSQAILLTLCTIIGVFAGYLISAILSARGIGIFGCSIVYQDIVRSPDGSRKILQYFRDCGATTGFQFSLSIIEDDKSIADQANNPFFVASGFKDDINYYWKGNNSIDVIVPKGRPSSKLSDQSRGIQIRYLEN